MNLQRHLDRLKCLLEIEPAEAAEVLTWKLEKILKVCLEKKQRVDHSVVNGLIFSGIINVPVQHDAIGDLEKKGK